MAEEESYGSFTRALHEGESPDPTTNAHAPPIYQTTAYAFDDVDHAASLFALERNGNTYSRIMNPTNAMLEERIASLAGGVGAIATASGMAALDLATLILAGQGDNVVTASSLYGGTHTYFSHTASRRGVEVRFVDTLDYDRYREAIDDDTAYVHFETIGNPSLVTPDIERIADIAHDHDVPLLVDNTFATPVHCRPLDHGADLVWHSTTKWMNGNGTAVGGALVAGGTFPWDEGDYPEITEPNPAYDGVNFRERFGPHAFVAAARARGVRDLGNQQSPFDAWLTLQKMETLPLRMDRHSRSARQVADFLADHEAVEWVHYPGRPDHETHAEAERYLEGGYGGMVTFGLEAGYEAAKRVPEHVELFSHVANVGDAKSLIIHPASTTHQQLTEAEQRASGTLPNLLRLSVGLETVDDLLADLDRAIEAATEGA